MAIFFERKTVIFESTVLYVFVTYCSTSSLCIVDRVQSVPYWIFTKVFAIFDRNFETGKNYFVKTKYCFCKTFFCLTLFRTHWAENYSWHFVKLWTCLETLQKPPQSLAHNVWQTLCDSLPVSVQGEKLCGQSTPPPNRLFIAAQTFTRIFRVGWF